RKKSVTESDEQARFYFDRAEKPGVSNLLTLFSVATKRSIEHVVPAYEDKMYGHLKKATAEAVGSMIEPIHARFKAIREEKNQLDCLL
ncbi:tryptophan--tRNA ligase, partial [Pseudoalteromonas sp. S1691]